VLLRKLAELVDARVLSQPLGRGPAFFVRGDIGRASKLIFPTIDQMLQPRLVLPPQATYICMYVLYPLPRGRVQLFNYLKV